jgi:hypothetical protein
MQEQIYKRLMIVRGHGRDESDDGSANQGIFAVHVVQDEFASDLVVIFHELEGSLGL